MNALEFARTAVDSWGDSEDVAQQHDDLATLESALICQEKLATAFVSLHEEAESRQALWEVLWNIVHEQLYLSAVALCKRGAFAEADLLLHSLEFRFRLSDLCWQQCESMPRQYRVQQPAEQRTSRLLAKLGTSEAAAGQGASGTAAEQGASGTPKVQRAQQSADEGPPRPVTQPNEHCPELETYVRLPSRMTQPCFFDLTTACDAPSSPPALASLSSSSSSPSTSSLSSPSAAAAAAAAAAASSSSSSSTSSLSTELNSSSWFEDSMRPILHKLAKAFSPSSSFWTGHSYGEPGVPFFSYLVPLAEVANNTVEAAIQHLFQLLLHSDCTADMMDDVSHAEWWVHKRGPHEPGHQLHFDVNETYLRKGRHEYRLSHPILSSVLYLSEGTGPFNFPDLSDKAAGAGADAAACTAGTRDASGDAAVDSGMRDVRGDAAGADVARSSGQRTSSCTGCQPLLASGAPTLVIDQSADMAGLGMRGWAAHPRLGRYLVFPGHLLHGVLPGPRPLSAHPLQKEPSEQQPQLQQCESLLLLPFTLHQEQPQRVTLIIAWWRSSSNVRHTQYPPGGSPHLLQPCMRAPYWRGPSAEDSSGGGGGEAGDNDKSTLLPVDMDASLRSPKRPKLNRRAKLQGGSDSHLGRTADRQRCLEDLGASSPGHVEAGGASSAGHVEDRGASSPGHPENRGARSPGHVEDQDASSAGRLECENNDRPRFSEAQHVGTNARQLQLSWPHDVAMSNKERQLLSNFVRSLQAVQSTPHLHQYHPPPILGAGAMGGGGNDEKPSGSEVEGFWPLARFLPELSPVWSAVDSNGSINAPESQQGMREGSHDVPRPGQGLQESLGNAPQAGQGLHGGSGMTAALRRHAALFGGLLAQGIRAPPPEMPDLRFFLNSEQEIRSLYVCT